MRPTESKKLSRDDPVEVSVFCPLVVLVFLHIKVGEVQPAILQSLVNVCEGVYFIRSMTQQKYKYTLR